MESCPGEHAPTGRVARGRSVSSPVRPTTIRPRSLLRERRCHVRPFVPVGDELGAAIGPLEVQAVPLLTALAVELVGDISTRCRTQPVLAGNALAAVTADMDHRRFELAQLAQQVERLCRPSGHELEAIPKAAALQLHPDRAHLGPWPERRGLAVMVNRSQG